MRHLIAASVVVAGLALLLALPAIGENELYSLGWWTVDSGGYVSSGTASAGVAYTLTSTIGQADAGLMSGGNYSLGGGFWGTAVGPRFKVYLPLVKRN